METSARDLVRRVIAAHVGAGGVLLDDAKTFDDLGLDLLDLVLIVVQLGSIGDLDGEFPFEALDGARTVGDLVKLVDAANARRPLVGRAGERWG